MKKFITAVLLLSTVFFSCNQAVNGEYATVVLDLGGSASGARAIGQNGLPFLKDTHITIEAVGRVGGTFVKEFAPGEAGSIALRFIAGDTVRLRVKASNASGIWSGGTTFTVEEGTNAVSVKLNKTISGAQALSFSITKFLDEYGHPYEHLDVYAGNKRLNSIDEILSVPSFCRDTKGRIFVAYYYNNGSGALDLVRYDSEGNNSTKMINGQQSGSVWHLASDLTTGKVYALDYSQTLYEVDETTSYTSWPSVSLSFSRIDCIAAHGGQLFVLGEQTSGTKLYVYNIESYPTPPPFQLDNGNPNAIAAPPSDISNYQYTDMFVTDDAVYLLRSDYTDVPDSHGKVYSKGALIKYEYDKDDKEIEDREEFGASDNGTQNGIVLTPDTSFYGPLQFIGFDDDVLYIADDGVKFTYFNEVPRITANKNRIASFNTSTNSLSFTDTSATWAKEEKLWSPSQKIKTLLWKKGIGGFDYYAVDSADSPLGAHPDLTSDFYKYTDAFCFDQAGNLYVVKEESGYKVTRYEPTADGSYDFTAGVTSTSLGTHTIKAIAVDVSGSIEKDGYRHNALYYIPDGLGDDKLHRLLWKVGDSFSSPAAYSYNPISIGPSASALAANKDGVFVAATEISANDYTLKVYKLKHTDTLFPNNSLTVGTGTTQNTADPDITYDEQINALQIVNGVLYGVSTKTMKKGYPIKTTAFSMSGKLLKLGNTNGSFTGTLTIDTALLYGQKDVDASSNGDFAPYRFIALKPKKLVIASDGGYGQEGTIVPQNKNRVLVFTLDGSGNTGAPASFDVTVEFSKRLTRDDTCGFKWE
ncbi:hypothetical protein [Treponema maltophilum]|uniref:hypothetical protein n=1 Tax=Treponema maltophilum TaxID=51160 RepID=UPI003D8FFFEB